MFIESDATLPNACAGVRGNWKTAHGSVPFPDDDEASDLGIHPFPVFYFTYESRINLAGIIAQ
jgi:hypothetical protein